MIRFFIEPDGAGGFRVLPADEASDHFASFIQMDVFGRGGLEELLAQTRAIRAGSLPMIRETRNAYDITITPEEVRLEFPPEDAVVACPTEEFEAFLAAILVEVDEAAAHLARRSPSP